MGARLLWEQEDLGSTPRCPIDSRLSLRERIATFAERKATDGSRELVAQARLITESR